MVLSGRHLSCCRSWHHSSRRQDRSFTFVEAVGNGISERSANVLLQLDRHLSLSYSIIFAIVGSKECELEQTIWYRKYSVIVALCELCTLRVSFGRPNSNIVANSECNCFEVCKWGLSNTLMPPSIMFLIVFFISVCCQYIGVGLKLQWPFISGTYMLKPTKTCNILL